MISSFPSIAAAKRSRCAPCSSRKLAISFLPICDAEPSAVSKSPPPQSQAALISPDSCSSNARVRSKSECATLTNSSTKLEASASFLSIVFSLYPILSFSRSQPAPTEYQRDDNERNGDPCKNIVLG